MRHKKILYLLFTLNQSCTSLKSEYFNNSVSSSTDKQASSLSVRVQGKNFIDAAGNTIQLRGVNLSGLEYVAIQGWSINDPWGGQTGAHGTNWAAIRSWKINTVRIPLNEASYLGYECFDSSGIKQNPDPGGNYKAAVKKAVTEATANGLYVVLDLHWTAPGNICPMLQTQMADADHALTFWTLIANTYKSYPNVLFELFNEPFLDTQFTGDAWSYMMNGSKGSLSGFPATDRNGNWKSIQQSWKVASYQDMITAVRSTGATNIVLVGSMQYSQDLSAWLNNRPTDPLNQMAATWHAYPTFGADIQSTAYAQPNFSPQIFQDVNQILANNIPVFATETGDHNTASTRGAPLVTTITQFADQSGISLLGWAWDVWSETDNVLIKDEQGTPTDGYGQVFFNWLSQHSSAQTTTSHLKKIMPMGDSLTGESRAYRLKLYDLLISQNFNNKNFQFVGTQTELYPTDGVSTLPTSQWQHEGYPGITISGLSLKVSAVAALKPDILFLQVGANDIAAYQSGSVEQIVMQYIELVKKIQLASPLTMIYACELTAQSHQLVPPFSNDRSLVVNQFNALLSAQLSSMKEYGTIIKWVRHTLTESDLRDGLHPNSEGYQKFAEDLFRGL